MFRIRTVLATAAVAIFAGLAISAPASAHDVIVSSTPAADEQLTAAPEQVTLTFSNQLLSLEENSGTAMIVEDASGTDWVAGAPVVEGDTVATPLKPGMPNGSYRVTWKVVSSDGHPTSGEYSFSVAAPDAPAVEPTPTAEQPITPSATPSAVPSASPTAAPVPSDAAPWPLLIGLGVVVLAAIVIFVIILLRRHH